MASRRLIIMGMIFMLLILLPFSGDAASVAAGPDGSAPDRGTTMPQMKIALKEGLLFLDVRDAEIGAVLRAIAEKTGIGLTVGEGVRGRVSLTLEGVSLEESLRRLCESRAILYEYNPETRTGRIIGAGAFASSSQPQATSRPDAAVRVPAVACGGSKTPNQGAVPVSGELQPKQGLQLPANDRAERLYDSQGRLRFKPGELLVRFHPGGSAEQIAALHQGLGSTLLKSLDNIKLHRIRLREGLTEREGIVLYAASEIVATAEQHALRYPLLTPNDPYYANNSQWGMDKIQMPAAWEKTTGSANVVVGVIDTGVDTGHLDLLANIWINPGEIPNNGEDDDQNGFIDDVHGWDFTGTDRLNGDNVPKESPLPNPPSIVGHGTHVAGIIAAVGNNNRGVAGVGWNLRIMPLKVMADTSSEMLVDDIIEAIDYAIAQRARIVNCSFGGEGDFSQAEYEAFNRLRLAGILAVCAAGNSHLDNDGATPMYPASYDLDNIISVAASRQTDSLWTSSNYGKNSVDLMAPGENISSTHICLGSDECNSYMSRSGTSMAAPHVAGVAGLILSLKPRLGYDRVKKILLENVDKIPAVSNLLVSGGRLNAAKALSQTCYPGEVTGGDGVGLADVIAALRIISGIDPGVSICRTADVDGDGRIGLAEAIYGLQFLSGIRIE
jgi:subtilisin family serine protease